MSDPRISILLSTYNGERYLEEFLDSVQEQDWPHWRIIARDDGSTDTTASILDRRAARMPVTFTAGARVGATNSFLELLYMQPGDCELVAFADQDDCWHRDKLSRAARAIGSLPSERPALYCSRAQIVDENLRELGLTAKWPSAPSFENALVENIAMGCTTVLNQAAVRLLTSEPPPRAARMHDWWCYLVVSAFGTVIFDPTPSLRYRQHPSSTVGAEANAWARLASKIARQFQGYSVDLLFAQARDFQNRYAARLERAQQHTLEVFLSFQTGQWRPSAFTSRAFRRQSPLDDILLRVMLALPNRRRRAHFRAARRVAES